MYEEIYQGEGEEDEEDGIYGAKYQDMTFLRAMPLLRVLEVVETDFVSLEGIDDLTRLKQLCCWLD